MAKVDINKILKYTVSAFKNEVKDYSLTDLENLLFYLKDSVDSPDNDEKQESKISTFISESEKQIKKLTDIKKKNGVSIEQASSNLASMMGLMPISQQKSPKKTLKKVTEKAKTETPVSPPKQETPTPVKPRKSPVKKTQPKKKSISSGSTPPPPPPQVDRTGHYMMFPVEVGILGPTELPMAESNVFVDNTNKNQSKLDFTKKVKKEKPISETIRLRVEKMQLEQAKLEETKRRHLAREEEEREKIKERDRERRSRDKNVKLQEEQKTRREEVNLEKTKLRSDTVLERARIAAEAKRKSDASKARNSNKRTSMILESQERRSELQAQAKKDQIEYKKERDSLNRQERLDREERRKEDRRQKEMERLARDRKSRRTRTMDKIAAIVSEESTIMGGTIKGAGRLASGFSGARKPMNMNKTMGGGILGGIGSIIGGRAMGGMGLMGLLALAAFMSWGKLKEFAKPRETPLNDTNPALGGRGGHGQFGPRNPNAPKAPIGISPSASISSMDAMIAENEKKYGLPPGLLKSIQQQESGGRADLIADPSKRHYQEGHKSSARGPFGIVDSTAKDPGFGVKPLQNNSQQEHARFAAEYLAARIRAAGSVYGGVAGYGEGDKYAKEVLGRIKQTPKVSPEKTSINTNTQRLDKAETNAQQRAVEKAATPMPVNVAGGTNIGGTNIQQTTIINQSEIDPTIRQYAMLGALPARVL